MCGLELSPLLSEGGRAPEEPIWSVLSISIHENQTLLIIIFRVVTLESLVPSYFGRRNITFHEDATIYATIFNDINPKKTFLESYQSLGAMYGLETFLFH